jgi:hypothetical protein
MTTWTEKIIGGRTYSLAHLQPFTVLVTPKAEGAPTFKVLVSFSSHPFSKEWCDSDPESHKIIDGDEIRCFCPIRHGHSLHLPSIVQAGTNGRAYFSLRDNFLLVHNLPGLNGPYAVFFSIEKARAKGVDAVMFVASAYHKPDLPKHIPAITFATLVAKTVRSERIVKPKK